MFLKGINQYHGNIDGCAHHTAADWLNAEHCSDASHTNPIQTPSFPLISMHCEANLCKKRADFYRGTFYSVINRHCYKNVHNSNRQLCSFFRLYSRFEKGIYAFGPGLCTIWNIFEVLHRLDFTLQSIA